MDEIKFNPRWREELVATGERGTLIFEITMGTLHVYFPSLERWLLKAPLWAKEHLEKYENSCRKYCEQNKIPFTITDDAQFYEERSDDVKT